MGLEIIVSGQTYDIDHLLELNLTYSKADVTSITGHNRNWYTFEFDTSTSDDIKEHLANGGFYNLFYDQGTHDYKIREMFFQKEWIVVYENGYREKHSEPAQCKFTKTDDKGMFYEIVELDGVEYVVTSKDGETINEIKKLG